MESIDHEPDDIDFRSYANYLAQTPESFAPWSGAPILFRRFRDAKLRILQSDLIRAPPLVPFMPLAGNGLESAVVHEPDQNEEERQAVELEVSGVHIWAASDYLYLYFPSSSRPGGLRISHSLITLHAIQPTAPPSIYLQLQSSDSPHDDHDSELTFELTLIPPPSLHPEDPPPWSWEDPNFSPTQALYDALRIAADLLAGTEDEDDVHGMEMVFDVSGGGDAAGDNAVGGLPPPMPGSGGWITSANVGEFFDEEGNWRGREAGAPLDAADDLGEGAGNVRPREDHLDGAAERLNGEETKRRRID